MLDLRNKRYYAYDKRIWHSSKGMQGEAYAYELQSDGLVHEWMWDGDAQAWVETDPNNDNEDWEDVTLIEALTSAIDREWFVLSLTDPMKRKEHR